jgi:predicted RNA-binding Zn-ribbon protein involved in translation (DUF1610 family)
MYRVYRYGTRDAALVKHPPVGWAQAVEQMERRVRYWNTLVRIERDRQEAYQQLRRQYLPEALAAYATAYETAATVAERVGLRRADPAQHAAYRTAVQQLRADPTFQAAVQALDAEAHARWLAARKESGLYWGNYDAVDQAYKTARRRPGQLRFHSTLLHATTVSVRWSYGLPVAALLAGQDTKAQLVPWDQWPMRPSRARGGRSWWLLRLRVGSDAQRQPVWLELPLVLHRPLPAEAVVRQIHVVRERLGARGVRWRPGWRWTAAICCDIPTPAVPPAQTRPDRGVLAIDLAWRRLATEEGAALRVAFWRDSAGHTGEVVLPPRVVEALRRPERLRSYRDQHFNEMRAALQQWLQTAAAVPDWLRQETRTLGDWRSPARLARLVWIWRDPTRRFPGDEAIYPQLEHWRRAREEHLYQYEVHQRDQALAGRREIYRRFAAWAVTAGYRVIRLEDFDLSQVARRRPSTNGTAAGQDLPQGARHQRVLAAVHTLRLAIEHAAEREGVRVERVPSAWTTQRCAACGELMQVDPVPSIWVTCPHCGQQWDQDDNACRNLLAWEPADARVAVGA